MNNLEEKPLSELAAIALDNWEDPYFGALPHLNTMLFLESIEEEYEYDAAWAVVFQFLNNSKSWQGKVANAVKSELKRRLDNYESGSSVH